jgi:hypothetical protein
MKRLSPSLPDGPVFMKEVRCGLNLRIEVGTMNPDRSAASRTEVARGADRNPGCMSSHG